MYGVPFPKHAHQCGIAGGTGGAPMYLQAKQNPGMTILLGAKTEKELPFRHEFERYSKLLVATEDGSAGYKGMVPDLLVRELGNIDAEYGITVGPERMMKYVVGVLKGKMPPKNIHLSIERYTKCGGGMCNSCSINGILSCVEGPVFDAQTVEEAMSDFGHCKRDAYGNRVPI